MREAIEVTARLTFDVDARLPLETQVEDCIADIMRLHDADSTTGVAFTGVQILDQLSEYDTTRLCATTIVVHVPKPEPTRLFADDQIDTAGAPCSFYNHYHCIGCQERWVMQWSCACNDRCPECNAEIEPYRSDPLVHSDHCKGLAFELRILGALISACEMLAGEMGQDEFQSETADTGLDAVLTARGAVAPLEQADLHALIGDLHRQLSIKRSKWALGQGEEGLDEDRSGPLTPTSETSQPPANIGD